MADTQNVVGFYLFLHGAFYRGNISENTGLTPSLSCPVSVRTYHFLPNYHKVDKISNTDKGRKMEEKREQAIFLTGAADVQETCS